MSTDLTPEQVEARLATVLCEDESWEHHDQTDDHPCARCKRQATALARLLADAEQRGADRVAAAVSALADEWYPGEPGPRRMTSWGQLAMERCARELRAALATLATPTTDVYLAGLAENEEPPPPAEADGGR